MTALLTIEREVHFQRRGRGFHKEMLPGKKSQAPVVEKGRVPRVSRLMALAIRFEQLVRSGQVADYAKLAELGHVSRARISQIMNLLLLAADLQEQILFLPRTMSGRDAIHLRRLQSIALTPDWRRQRRMWHELTKE